MGDSAYALRKYLLTPLLNPVTRSEMKYNKSHKTTRNTIERCFGLWKRRFPVLAYGIRLKLDTGLTVIVATAVLHNIANQQGESQPPETDDFSENFLRRLIRNGQIEINRRYQEGRVGLTVRNNLINNYFYNL